MTVYCAFFTALKNVSPVFFFSSSLEDGRDLGLVRRQRDQEPRRRDLVLVLLQAGAIPGKVGTDGY